MGRARARSRTMHRKTKGGVEGLAERTRRANEGARRVKVGLPKSSAPYPDGTNVILVGAVHEFGSDDGSIPERSFLRAALRKHRDEYRKLSGELQARYLRGEISYEEALEILGTRFAADVQEMIADLRSPPNTPETARRKGSSNPLIDTGHLRQQITHQVDDE